MNESAPKTFHEFLAAVKHLSELNGYSSRAFEECVGRLPPLQLEHYSTLNFGPVQALDFAEEIGGALSEIIKGIEGPVNEAVWNGHQFLTMLYARYVTWGIPCRWEQIDVPLRPNAKVFADE